MGFEIKYLYYERKEEGGYNTEEKKEMVKRLGSHFDETSLEKAAAAVLAQLARRDIWVVDVEIHEYVKREIKFKEAKDGSGIVLKNKKFSFDSTANMIVEEETEVASPVSQIGTNLVIRQPTHNGGGPVNLAAESIDPRRRLFSVIFEPPAQYIDEARRLHFTEGRRYSVHRTKEHPRGPSFGSMYTLTDDTKQVVETDEKFFTVAGMGLVGEENEPMQQDEGPKLLYEDQMRHQPVNRNRIDRSHIPEQFQHIPIEGEEPEVDMISMPVLRKMHI